MWPAVGTIFVQKVYNSRNNLLPLIVKQHSDNRKKQYGV